MAFSIARAAASASARRSTTGLAGGAHLPQLPHLNRAPSRRSVLVGAGSTWPPLRPRHGRASSPSQCKYDVGMVQRLDEKVNELLAVAKRSHDVTSITTPYGSINILAVLSFIGVLYDRFKK